jgi:hypothetical protein
MDPVLTSTDPQALATIEAARITAEATARAAWIQAAAAIGAITAGALAYFGAVRQVRLQERAQEARAAAYRFRLSNVVERYHAQIAKALGIARQQLKAFYGHDGSAHIISLQVVKPEPLHDENWEVHALLGRRAVRLILIIDETSLRLAQFDNEIRQDNIATDAHFESAAARKAAAEADDGAADGGARPESESAIVEYVRVLDVLHQALTDLKHELGKAPRRVSWLKLWRFMQASTSL